MRQPGKTQPHTIQSVVQTICCIVGGGPAGAVLAYLLARAGIDVTLLEAHMDFERDFRGDTIHASVMEIMEELGLAERLLQIRHAEARKLTLDTTAGKVTIADLTRLKTKYPYVTVMAQSKFLDFITAEAKHYPNFHLQMGAQVDELIEENGNVRGVRYRGQDGWYELHALLTVGADGRFSRLRRLSGFTPIKTSPPMDVLWFRLSRKETDHSEGLAGRFSKGAIVVLLDRFDYWQIGYVIAKGSYQQIHAAGLAQFRQQFAQSAPDFADRVAELQDWKQISVLSVESDRLPRWYRPGLLLIGDAAHVMSPVGGVGINYAIQDAVMTANILTDKLKAGVVEERDLARVQRERELPTRLLQAFQTLLQKNIFAHVINSPEPMQLPFTLRLLLHVPFIRTLPASFIAFGPFPVHIKDQATNRRARTLPGGQVIIAATADLSARPPLYHSLHAIDNIKSIKEHKMPLDRIRTINKHFTNPLLRRFAHSSRGPFAVIRHVGRRSGKSYETTIMAWPLPAGDGVIIALTYGPEVDWYRNVLAAGHCTLLWHNKVYSLGEPDLMDAKAALPAFSQPFRAILRRSGTQHFVSMKYL